MIIAVVGLSALPLDFKDPCGFDGFFIGLRPSTGLFAEASNFSEVLLHHLVFDWF